MPLAQVEPGLAHTGGLVGVHTRPIEAPLAIPPCVFYRFVVKNAEGALLFEGRSADELLLEDGAAAKIVVKLDDATWRLGRAHELVSTPKAPNASLKKYLTDRGLAADGEVHARMEWIAPHEFVFVRGLVTRVGEDASDYRTIERARLVMTAATLALSEA